MVSARLLDQAEREPRELQAGRVRTLLRRRLDAAARPVHLAVEQTLDEPRLQQLLDRLDALGKDAGWTRKAAKRLRYAADVGGAEWASVAKAAKRLQTTLGEANDSAVAQRWWLRLGHDPEAGAAAFTYGRLHAAEVRLQHKVRREYDERLRALADLMG